MKNGLFRQLHTKIRRFTCTVLMAAMVVTGVTVSVGTETADAAANQAIAWTRVYNTEQLMSFKDYMDKGEARVLLIYDDRYYIGDSSGISGYKYKGKTIPAAFKLDQDFFVTRKSYNTPTIKYDGADKDNNCNRFNIRLRTTEDKPGNLLLLHDEWRTFVWCHHITFQANISDRQSEEEGPCCFSSERHDDPSLQFAEVNEGYKRQYFIERRLNREHNGKPMSELSDESLKKLKTQIDNDIATAYMIGWLSATTDADVSDIMTTLTLLPKRNPEYMSVIEEVLGVKNIQFSEDMLTLKNPKPTDKNATGYSTQLSAYKKEADSLLKGEWADYRKMWERGGYGMYDPDVNKAMLFWNLSGTFDVCASFSGSTIDSRTWYEPCGYTIYIGIPETSQELTSMLKVDANSTYTVTDVTIPENAVFEVPQDATVVMRGTIYNYGGLDVRGTLILDNGCIITDDTSVNAFSSDLKPTEISQKWPFTLAGTVRIRDGGLLYVRPEAALVQNAAPKLRMEDNSMLLIDGTVILNGYFGAQDGTNQYIEVGSTGQLVFGAAVKWDDSSIKDDPQLLLKQFGRKGIYDIVSPVKTTANDMNNIYFFGNGSYIKNYGDIYVFSHKNYPETVVESDGNAFIAGYNGEAKILSNRITGVHKLIAFSRY